jgi:hypothetical protein
MNKHSIRQTVSPGLLYSVAPEQISQLCMDDDLIGDEFDWDETQAVGDTFGADALAFLRDWGND